MEKNLIKTIPLFPLNIVVFPGEGLNLHIFEPRYQQLLKHCLEYDIPFGIVPIIEGKIKNVGTEVRIVRVEKTYEDGKADIKTLGMNFFNLLSYENPAPGFLFAQGEIEVIEKEQNNSKGVLKDTLSELVDTFFKYIDPEFQFMLKENQEITWQIGHKIGLKLEKEYLLITLESEESRYIYLIEYLKSIIELLEELERAKEKIKMNGSFKFFDPIDF